MDTTAQLPALRQADDVARLVGVARRTVERRAAAGPGVLPRHDPRGRQFSVADDFVGAGGARSTLESEPPSARTARSVRLSGTRAGPSEVASDAAGTVLRMDAPTTLPTLWRCDDVAAFYGVSRRTVERWAESGKGVRPRLDPGGRPYWIAAEIVAAAMEPPPDLAPSANSVNRPTAVVGKARR